MKLIKVLAIDNPLNIKSTNMISKLIVSSTANINIKFFIILIV